MRACAVSFSITLCAAAALAAPPPVRLAAPHSVDHLGALDLKDARTLSAAEGKVSSRLRPQPAGPLAGGLVPAEPVRDPSGKLRVFIDCSTVGDTQLASLAQAGARIEAVHASRGRVEAGVDDGALDTIAAFSWVRAIRPVDRRVVRAGSVTTEGDQGARADLVRAQGLDGTGVVVGVISDGIDSRRDAQQTGDLPEVTIPNDPRCRRGRGDEGTALLEIVHDVAPGARLLFAGPETSLEMVEAVECLVDAGANVIVDDLGFFFEPYFEDGPVAAAVRAAVADGVSYHSSAGNDAENHLEEDFFPPDGQVHDFARGAGDNTDTMVVPAGGTLTCILQWNDPFGAAADDYDLALLDANLNVVAASVDVQDGTQDPIEAVAIENPTDTDQLASVVIQRFAGAPRRLELFCLGAAGMEHNTAAGSIIGHPALPEVVAVGAIDVADPGLDDVESFSSQGPCRIDFPAPESRAKPDLAGFDGVSISNAGGFPACPPFCAFFGTSAAAPHSAGVAALLLQKDPSLTPAAVQAALQQGAVDIGPDGFDDASGFGRLDALRASDAVVLPACSEDADCDDGDVCTADACGPAGSCVSPAPAGPEGLLCRLTQLGAPDVCVAGDIDDRTQSVVDKRVAKALALLDKASQASRPAARVGSFAKIARQLGLLRSRIERAVAKGTTSNDCASSLERLIDGAAGLARGLAG